MEMAEKFLTIEGNPSGLKRSMEYALGEKEKPDEKKPDETPSVNNEEPEKKDDNHNPDEKPSESEQEKPDESKKPEETDVNDFLKEFDEEFIKALPKEEIEQLVKADKKEVAKKYFETQKTLKELQNQISQKEEEIKKFSNSNEFFEGLKKDFIGTYKRFQKEYGLPDLDFIQKQVQTGGDVASRLAQWQKEELVKQIADKFEIDPEEFVYDPSEAYTAGTPSYEYRIRTEQRERELLSEYDKTKASEEEALKKVVEQRNKDLLELRKTYFPDEDFESPEKADEAFVAHLQKLDEMYSKMQEGDFSPKGNPFSLYNIFRGVMFDDLVSQAVNKAVQQVHEEYHKHSLYLPEDKEIPTDATQVKGENVKPKVDDKKRKFSPLYRTMKV